MVLTDKVVVITGASSGIGRACAAEFYGRGAKVVLAARREELLCSVADQFDPSGRRSLVVPTDVTREEQCRELIAQTIAYFGRVDVLVCNAGVSMRAGFLEADNDVLKRLMDVNFWGTVYCVRAALPHLLANQGSIVGVCSVAGYIGLPGRTGYSASKFAMRGFLDTVRSEYLNSGLHVFVVAPGFTASDVRLNALTADGTPQGQTPRDEQGMMSAESVARAIRKGVERRKRSLVLTFVEGKLAVFLSKWWPSLVDRLSNRAMRREPNSPVK